MKRTLIDTFLPLRPRIFLPLLAALLWGCDPGPAEPPEEVATTFWAATLTGDTETVRQLVLPGHFVQADFDTARHHQIFTSVVIGDAEIQSERARVDTRLEGVFYGEPDQVEFSTVAVIHEGEWKIDYSATAAEMIGALLGDAITEVDEEMRDDIKVLEDELERSIREDLKNFDAEL